MSADAQLERRTETVPQWKRDEVDDITDLLGQYESVGIVSITGIPSRQLQNMRRGLHGRAVLRVSRNTLLRMALDEVDDGLEALVDHVDGQVGIIASNDNPFGLYKQLEASKTPAPINEGEVAPNDIEIPAGDTGVDPGPFVGDLQAVGAAARIQEGSIVVTEDSTVLKAGETVSAQLAGVLGELGIEPKEVGLDLRAVHSDGVLFEPDELAIDIDEYRTNVAAAATAARNLSVNAVYPTATTISTIIARATGEAKSLGLHASIESPDLASDLLSRADAQVRALAALIDDDEALPEELRGIEAVPAESSVEPEEPTDDEKEDATAADADSDDDEDEDDAAGEGLGALFG